LTSTVDQAACFVCTQIKNSNTCWESKLKQMCEYDIKLKLCAEVCVCLREEGGYDVQRHFQQ